VSRTVDVANISEDDPPVPAVPAEDDPPIPAIVLVAQGTVPAALVLPVPAELGRWIVAAGKPHEVDDDRMSRDHALVTLDRGLWVIADRDSRNGTFVDGERIQGEVRRRGDVVVRLGHTVFILVRDGRGHGGLDPADQVVGPELARAHDKIRRHAASPTLLIHGEPGSGKELAAQLYHAAGPRSAGPFVAVNCAALPAGLAERLLFGSKKGAFSGAIDAMSHFQMARGGTLFLDEIAELEPAVQAKLLRVLEARETVPAGATSGAPVDLGIVAASHRDLRQAVGEGQFRDDLYDRLALTTVHLPPLRARKVDIAHLVQREVALVNPMLAPHAKLLEACCVRAWPGNVRELRGAVRQAANEAIAAGREIVRLEDLAPGAGVRVGPAPGDTAVERPTTARAVEIDKDAVVAALARANHVVSIAARTLGLHRTQLYRLMEEHGIARDDE
jgi:transcriptional regulator of acetoin/glycerol metabolism